MATAGLNITGGVERQRILSRRILYSPTLITNGFNKLIHDELPFPNIVFFASYDITNKKPLFCFLIIFIIYIISWDEPAAIFSWFHVRTSMINVNIINKLNYIFIIFSCTNVPLIEEANSALLNHKGIIIQSGCSVVFGRDLGPMRTLL